MNIALSENLSSLHAKLHFSEDQEMTFDPLKYKSSMTVYLDLFLLSMDPISHLANIPDRVQR